MSYDPVGYRRAEPYGHQPYGRPEPPVIYGRPYRPAPPPPPPAAPPKPSRWPYLVLGAALVFLAGGLWTVYDHGLIVKDSGVQACEDLRDNRAGYDRPMTERDYLALRKTFEDSRYDDIREHGTKLVDVVWQVARQSGDEHVVEALAEHATGLQSACADQGIIVNLS